MEIEITVKTPEQDFAKNFEKTTHEIIKKVGDTSLKYLQQNTPIRTGALRNSWRKDNNSLEKISITSTKNYARFVNDGTGIYGVRKSPIRPKNTRVLRFKSLSGYNNSSGEYVYVKQVRGQPGKHMVEKSLEETEKQVPFIASMIFERRM